MSYRIFNYDSQAKAKAAAQILSKAGKTPCIYEYKGAWQVQFMVIED